MYDNTCKIRIDFNDNTKEELQHYFEKTKGLDKPWLNLPWDKMKKNFAFIYTTKQLGLGTKDHLDWMRSSREIYELAKQSGVFLSAREMDDMSAIIFIVERRKGNAREWTKEEIEKYDVPPNYPSTYWAIGVTDKIKQLINGEHAQITLNEESRKSAHSIAKQLGVKVSCNKDGAGNIIVKLNNNTGSDSTSLTNQLKQLKTKEIDHILIPSNKRTSAYTTAARLNMSISAKLINNYELKITVKSKTNN